MGEYYLFVGMKCAYCSEKQEEVYYAESAGHTEHICEQCGEKNSIKKTFMLVKKTRKNSG